MQPEVSLFPLREEPGSAAFRLETGREPAGWAVVSGGRIWLWAEGLRPLQAAHPDDPFTYEAWAVDHMGTPYSLGAVGPGVGGVVLTTYPLPDPEAVPAGILLTAQRRGAEQPMAVVLAGRATPRTLAEAGPGPQVDAVPATDHQAGHPSEAQASLQPDPLPRQPQEPHPEREPAAEHWGGPPVGPESASPGPEPAPAPAGVAGGHEPDWLPMGGAGGPATPVEAPVAAPTEVGAAANPVPTGLDAVPDAGPACPPGCQPRHRASVPLSPHERTSGRGQGTAVLDFDQDSIIVTLRGLPAPDATGESPHTGRPFNAYRVWLHVAGTRRVQSLGVATRVWTDTYRVHLREGANLRQFDTVLVTAEDRAGSASFPAGPVLLSGRYTWYEPA